MLLAYLGSFYLISCWFWLCCHWFNHCSEKDKTLIFCSLADKLAGRRSFRSLYSNLLGSIWALWKREIIRKLRQE